MMNVLQFMNHYEDWEERITKAPYNIKISRDGDYVLLKYNQLTSDFSVPLVRECRGAIFRKINNKWMCVCRAFDKFFNYGEANAAYIDWDSAVVEEKIDGSLIKFFYDNHAWRIATNGTIHAFNAQVGDSDLSFGDLVVEAFGGEENFENFLETLYITHTYMFELVSPKSQVTIPYKETKLYYLCERDINTMEQFENYNEYMASFGVLCPKTYDLTTFDECLNYVNQMSKDQEGFVIHDAFYNRIKMKSPEFLAAFHANNNGMITTKRVINMMKENKLDDFLAYAPRHRDFVEEIERKIQEIAANWDMDYDSIVAPDMIRAKLAVETRNYPNLERSYFFQRFSNNSLTAFDFIISLSVDKIKELIKEKN